MTTTIIWAIVVALTLLIEFFTTDLFASCFTSGSVVALILSFWLDIRFQIPAFLVVSFLAMIIARPLLKKWLFKKTVPTNLDQNFGKQTKLLADVVDGKSTIKINDVVWTAICDRELKQGDLVTIESTEGNKIIVKGVEK